MREAVFDSAVLADADRKSCGEDVFCRVAVTIVVAAAGRACPFPDVERLGAGLGPAHGAQLRARIILVVDVDYCIDQADDMVAGEGDYSYCEPQPRLKVLVVDLDRSTYPICKRSSPQTIISNHIPYSR